MAIVDTVALSRLQQQLERIGRLGLAQLPTSLEPLSRLTAHLGGPRVWVKREDCTGLGFGDNKLRKLDHVLAEAIDHGADTLVSGGVVQSNSQRQVAATAAKLGLACHLAVYHGRVEPPTPQYESSGNALLTRLYGASLHAVPWAGDRNRAIAGLADDLRSLGRRPYVVPYGVSSALGAVGYVSALLEIAAQCAALGFTPRAIVHCSGSGGTQAGLALGAASVLPETDIVDIDAEPERVAADVRQYARAAAEVLEVSFDDGVSRWSQATRAEPMAPFKKPQSRRCSWPAGSRRWYWTPSIPPRGLPGSWHWLEGVAGRRPTPSCSCTPAAHRRCSHTKRRWAYEDPGGRFLCATPEGELEGIREFQNRSNTATAARHSAQPMTTISAAAFSSSRSGRVPALPLTAAVDRPRRRRSGRPVWRGRRSAPTGRCGS